MRNKKQRVFRMCGEARETLEHMMRACTEMRKSEKSREDVLNKDGKASEWIKKVKGM